MYEGIVALGAFVVLIGTLVMLMHVVVRAQNPICGAVCVGPGEYVVKQGTKLYHYRLKDPQLRSWWRRALLDLESRPELYWDIRDATAAQDMMYRERMRLARAADRARSVSGGR